jgi:hypothetical protein
MVVVIDRVSNWQTEFKGFLRELFLSEIIKAKELRLLSVLFMVIKTYTHLETIKIIDYIIDSTSFLYDYRCIKWLKKKTKGILGVILPAITVVTIIIITIGLSPIPLLSIQQQQSTEAKVEAGGEKNRNSGSGYRYSCICR